MVYFTCPKCQSSYQVKDIQLAEYIWCRKCRCAIKVSSNETDAPDRSIQTQKAGPHSYPDRSSFSAALRESKNMPSMQRATSSNKYDRDRDALLQLKQTLHETIKRVQAQTDAMAKLEQALAEERKLRTELEKQLVAQSADGATVEDVPQRVETSRSHANEASDLSLVPEEQSNQEKLADAAMIELLLRFSKR